MPNDIEKWKLYYEQREKRKNIQKTIAQNLKRLVLITDMTGESILTLKHLMFVTKKRRTDFIRVYNQYITPKIPLKKFLQEYQMVYKPNRKLRDLNVTLSSYLEPPRLYPLNVEVYSTFAKRFWIKNGSPTFRKRKITGVIFGRPVTLISRCGRYPYISERYIGVYPHHYHTEEEGHRTKLRIKVRD